MHSPAHPRSPSPPHHSGQHCFRPLQPVRPSAVLSSLLRPTCQACLACALLSPCLALSLPLSSVHWQAGGRGARHPLASDFILLCSP